MISFDQFVAELPAPLNEETYTLLRQDVWGADDIEVYINSAEDFAFLYPTPVVDYDDYQPRSQKLNLMDAKKGNVEIFRRFEKIKDQFNGCKSVLEIGASEGTFLAQLNSHNPSLSLASVEPDQATAEQRNQLSWLRQFSQISGVMQSEMKFDVICLFHVFEHIAEPTNFLEQVRACLSVDGKIIIEVPSLYDPLLKLYDNEAYAGFYFQKQHPYIYAPTSLTRLLERNGFRVTESIAHQRYGLENHMNWLMTGQPGGSSKLRELFSGLDAQYRSAIEANDLTDSFFLIGEIELGDKNEARKNSRRGVDWQSSHACGEAAWLFG